MSYRIISRSSSYLERSILYEVDGEVKRVSAPVETTTFADLERQIDALFTDQAPPVEESAAPEVAKKPSQKRSKKSATAPAESEQ